eukprot:scaffold183_cov249-Pinguiococcus_pyrenoidosus.AAC.18
MSCRLVAFLLGGTCANRLRRQGKMSDHSSTISISERGAALPEERRVASKTRLDGHRRETQEDALAEHMADGVGRPHSLEDGLMHPVGLRMGVEVLEHFGASCPSEKRGPPVPFLVLRPS